MKEECKVTFEPTGRRVYVLPGTTIFEAAARAGLLLEGPCGGKGTCGKCRVRVVKGAGEPSAACRELFDDGQLADGFRLACQASVQGECVVDVPEGSLFDSRSQILTAGAGGELGGKPAVRKTYVELPAPTSEDPAADLKRLERVAGKLDAGLGALRSLPSGLRSAGWSGTVAACSSRLLAFEPGHTEGECYGVAFDLGTTTLVAALMDLTDRRELAVTATMNPQISSGDDVISRITRARDETGGVEEMQQAVVQAFNEMIGELAEQCEVDRNRIYEATVAGNTTMQHLLCGLSPAALGEVPFPPVYAQGLQVRASEVGLDIHPNAGLYVFPNIGGFVGGDTVAGILANSLQEAAKPVVFVDIGTNGEIVLACEGRLMATSTAAGPAFEGARIVAGMRAAHGAIEKVVMGEDDILINVIGNASPMGICGTALIDVAAELLRLGVIDTTGRLLPPEEIVEPVPERILARVQECDGQTGFLLADASETETGEPIHLLQRDVRELQLATGAIRAGVSIMLRMADLGPDDLEAVLLAGAFGNFIRPRNARRIGLLPPIPLEKIRFVGNAASTGAKVALLSEGRREVADRIAGSAEHVDLSLDPEFQMEFGMAMMFPEEE